MTHVHVSFRKRRQRYGEKALENVFREVLDSIPRRRVDELVQGKIDGIEFTERVTTEMDREWFKIEEALYAILLQETKESDEQIREAVNRNMRQLGSPVRLKKPAIEKAVLTPEFPEWSSVPYDPFNVAYPDMVLRVQARRQAGEILSHIAATERDTILAQIELGYTQVQEFNTGRVVTGRTRTQTARGIFQILETTAPTITPETATIYRSQYTNGLFPRWANAVNKYADRTAEQLKARGITGERAAELLDKRTKRYADKLRRSRAKMIARTETSIAQATARQASYEACIDSGICGPQATKTWNTAGFDVCNICSPLSGKRIPIKSLFYWSGGFRGGSGLQNPAHPNCRCKTLMDPVITQPPQLIGSNTPDDPFRYQFADGFTPGINPVA